MQGERQHISVQGTGREQVSIVDYEPKYRAAFKSLNEAWISKYFEIEETDRNALDHSDEYILSKGGRILVALYEGGPVGVCALIRMDDPEYDYELAKMAVAPKVQGKGIGWLLGKAVLDKARVLGARKIYLESNSKLAPAINLYYKLGFQKIPSRYTPYNRCDIQMEFVIN